ncbi:MAG: 6-phosphogluconolactonase [Candidatus Saccharimonadales bacterium]
MKLSFQKTTNSEIVSDWLTEVIAAQLGPGKKVLWLIPGGSAMTVAIKTALKLPVDQLGSLTLTLTDERYGPVGHPDSNWLQLQNAGLHLPGATRRPVLSGHDMQTTVENFADLLKTQTQQASYTIGLFGIGEDGHTAGILPGSKAVKSGELAVGYDAGKYKRITITPAAIAKLDEAVVYASGEAKHPELDKLGKKLPIEKQPAQALKQAGKLTIFNDYKGGSGL